MQAERIEQQLQNLKSQSYIRNFIEEQPLTYQIQYVPQIEDTFYFNLPLNIRLSIPESYPQKPPLLNFISRVYHLNIDINTGQVKMDILNEDWSPYLSINDIFLSLEELMKDPDTQNPVNNQIQEQYHNQLDKYFDKVQKSLSLGAHIQEKQEQIDIHSQNTATLHHLSHNNSFQASLSRQQQDQIFQSIENNQHLTKNESMKKKLPYPAQKSQNKLLTNQKISFQTQQERVNQSPIKLIMPTSEINKLPTNIKYEEMILSLKKTDELILIFSKECEDYELKINSCLNQRIRVVFEKKLNKQWQMLEQLFQIESELKVRLMGQVKNAAFKFIK